MRLGSRRGRFLDYQAGLFFIDVQNDVDYQKIWGADAGAWYASPTQYSRLDADPSGRFLLQQSLNGLNMSFNSPTGTQHIRNRSGAPFAQANWHVTPSLVLTTGTRLTFENRRNNGRTFIRDNGFAPELNPVVVNGVALGGFASTAAGALSALNSLEQLALADRTAGKHFGVAVTDVPGAAYNALLAAQKQQIADAKAIRAAQIGVVFDPKDAEPFEASQPSFVVSPLYKINDQINTYVSWQYGEKAGIAQFVNGASSLARSEKSAAYEWGVKSVLLNRKLLLNADLFLTNITDYQQAVRVLDVYTTALNNDGNNYYTTATGNVPKVRAKGLEVDGVFAGIRNVSVRFAGAYNDARYTYFPNSAQPAENGYAGAAPYRDVSGPAAPWCREVHVQHRSGCPDSALGRHGHPCGLQRGVHQQVQRRQLPVRLRPDPRTQRDGSLRRVRQAALRRQSRREEPLQRPDPPDQYLEQLRPAVPRWVGVQFTGKL